MKNPNSIIQLRIEQMFIRISGYDFELKYVKGVENISDYTSRHPLYNPNQHDENEAYINFVATYATPNAFTLDDIKRETLRDTTLKTLDLIRNNSWYKLANPEIYEKLDALSISDLKRFSKVKHELTVNKSSDIILKGRRIVLPRGIPKYNNKISTPRTLGYTENKSIFEK